LDTLYAGPDSKALADAFDADEYLMKYYSINNIVSFDQELFKLRSPSRKSGYYFSDCDKN